MTNRKYCRRVGLALANIRTGADMTQAQLAAKAGVSATTVRETELGMRNITLGSLAGIIEAAGSTMDELFKKAKEIE